MLRAACQRTYVQGSAAAIARRCFSTAAVTYPDTTISTLKNGLRVASEGIDADTATIGMYIDAGSRFETTKNNGTAHFLEHMAFKGTTNRSYSELVLEVENMGALLNAYTARELTCYWVQVMKQDVPQAVDILSDILQNAKLDPKNIESERGVILKETEEVYTNTEELVQDHLHSIAFQGTALGRTILGPIENIKSIQRTDLEQYIKEHYTAPRMILVGAGGVDHEQLVALGEKHFASLSPETSQVPSPVEFTGSEVRQRDDRIPLAHMAIAVEAVGWNHPDFYALGVATSLVGRWDRSFGAKKNTGSRLVRDLLEHGSCESYSSFNIPYADTGLWGVYLVTPPDRCDDAVFSVQQEWMRLCTDVSDSEVERAKNNFLTEYLSSGSRMGSSGICDTIGRDIVVHGRRVNPAEVIAKVQDVTAEMVRQTASKYLYDQDIAFVGVGSIEAMPDYNRVRSGMVWKRY